MMYGIACIIIECRGKKMSMFEQVGILDLEDYGTVGVDGESDEIQEYPNMSIKIDKDQYSIFELKRKYDRGLICMDPAFQRNFVWSSKQKSELIESVIMGIPLPLIYLAENKSGEMIVVDGRQRLTTFIQFLNNEFRLSKLKILPELNGYKFEDLENSIEYSRFATDIEDFQILVRIIKYPTPDRVRFDIFDRVNRGGTTLNKQEMRNALYQGKATAMLKELSECQEFKDATGSAISPKHMKDRYIILRALTFWLYNEGKLHQNGKKIEYKSDIEEFLGLSMEFFNAADVEYVEEIKWYFRDVMKRIYKILGEDAFRIPSTKGIRRPISMTLFEAIYYLFALLGGNGTESGIRDSVKNLLANSEFLRCLEFSVDSSTAVQTRFEKVYQVYMELIRC